MEVHILGCGTSNYVPSLRCLNSCLLTKPSAGQMEVEAEYKECKVCSEALENEHSRNRRLNTSILIRFASSQDGLAKNILVDCGKTFYESARRFLVPLDVHTLDAVLLTHGHADAVLGMDDLRNYSDHRPLDVHLNAECHAVVARAFPYLTNRSLATGGGDVSDLRFHVFADPIDDHHHLLKSISARGALGPHLTQVVPGLWALPVPVQHGLEPDGRPFYCSAFLFFTATPETNKGSVEEGNSLIEQTSSLTGDYECQLAYVSDISHSNATLEALLGRFCPKLLLLDCLHRTHWYTSHFGLQESLALAKLAKADLGTGFIGMGHQFDFYDSQLTNHLREQHVFMCYDGQRLLID
jgi:phosphoribosyl 1,2-cyclic phosphodiesterase